MASMMIKVAREGLVSKALKSADVGPTSGDSIVYEIQNVPDGTTVDSVITAFKGYKPGPSEYEIDWAKLPG